MPMKVLDKITYPFPNFNGYTVEFCKRISNLNTLYYGCNYLSMLGLKLIHVIKRGLRPLNQSIGVLRDLNRKVHPSVEYKL